MPTSTLRRAVSRGTPELINIVLIVLGVLSANMGLHGFLLSSNFIDGGVTGVSMLMSKVTGTTLSVWLPVFNLPFIALGFRQIGGGFALRSALAIGGLSLAVALIPFPDVTHDRVLNAVFGGFFLGAGIGLAVRGGAVLDGTEIAALLISKRSHLLKVGDVILLFNVCLFLFAMTLLGVEEALYSILTYVAAARTLDFVIHGIEEFTAITIVSRMALQAFGSRGKTIVTARPTWDTVAQLARRTGSQTIEVPLTREHSHDLDAMRARVDQHTGVIYLCNPHNPTGTLTRRQDIDVWLQKIPQRPCRDFVVENPVNRRLLGIVLGADCAHGQHQAENGRNGDRCALDTSVAHSEKHFHSCPPM